MIDPPDIRAAKQKLAAYRKAQRKAWKNPTKGRRRDAEYLHWLHDLPCVACLKEGPTGHPIEAAHQDQAGTGPMLGRRTDDCNSVPLCSFHHRLAPNACDPAQRKFWDRLGIDIKSYCRALYDCFRQDGDGESVVREFAK